MSIIKPRTRGKELVRLYSRLERENHETLHAYAQFLGETPEYVLNQLVECVLSKDKEFLTWRAEHPQSYAPHRPVAASAGTARRTRSSTSIRRARAPEQVLSSLDIGQRERGEAL